LNKSTRSKLLILITLRRGCVSSGRQLGLGQKFRYGLTRSLLHCHPSLRSETVYVYRLHRRVGDLLFV